MKISRVRVSGRRLELALPMHTFTRTLAGVTRRSDGSLAIDLRDESGAIQHATATMLGSRLHLTVRDGKLRGTADLVRD